MPMHEGSGSADEFVIEVEVNGEVIGELTPIVIRHFHFDGLVEEPDGSPDSEEQSVEMFIVNDDGQVQRLQSNLSGSAFDNPEVERLIMEFIRQMTGE